MLIQLCDSTRILVVDECSRCTYRSVKLHSCVILEMSGTSIKFDFFKKKITSDGYFEISILFVLGLIGYSSLCKKILLQFWK